MLSEFSASMRTSVDMGAFPPVWLAPPAALNQAILTARTEAVIVHR